MFYFIAAPIPNVKIVQHIEVFQNDPLMLNCSTTSNPVPTYQWFKDVCNVDCSKSSDCCVKLPSNTSIFNVKTSTLDDTGLYKCIASNTVSKSEIRFYKTVLGKFHYSFCVKIFDSFF